jgi:hypothetical protein
MMKFIKMHSMCSGDRQDDPVHQCCKIPCLDIGSHHKNFVSIRCRLQNGAHALHPLEGQTDDSRRVPDLGCEQDGQERSIRFFRLPHVCASWCEVGHCREGKGRLSGFG